MKKIFLILFVLSFSFNAWADFDRLTSKKDEGIYCKLYLTIFTTTDNCVATPSAAGEYFGGSAYGPCSNVTMWEVGMCKSYAGYPTACPSWIDTAVGGCGGTPIYCSTSPVYQKVNSFLGIIENASTWSYYSTIGKDNNTYKCVLSYTRPSGQTVILITGTALSTHNPVGASDCINDAAYNALINTNCNLSSGWAKNSGYVTNYRDGTPVTQNPDTTEGTIVPAGSTPVSPSGTPITSSTGLDGNKDGYDDVTGQPIPFTPASGSGISDSDGDGTGEVEIKDPEPSEIPAVPSGGEYDTEITAPDQKPLSGLFDILDSSPFISVLQDTKIQLSGSQCLLTTAEPVYGQYISFDFCDSRIVNILDYLGIAIIALAAITAILLIFV